MEEIKVTPRKLKELIDNGIFVGKGYYGSVFTFQDRLIKLDNVLYYLLKKHNINECERQVYYRYLGGIEQFNDAEQIEWLSNKQKDVRLTKLPQGIIRLKDSGYCTDNIIPGIIIPYHKGYDKLEKMPKDNREIVMIVLNKLLMKVQELEDNGISQEDLYHPIGMYEREYNILYKDDNPEIIDLSGPLVKCGKDYIAACSMYIELGHVIIDFLDYYHVIPPFPRWYTDTYDKDKELIKELSKKLKY